MGDFFYFNPSLREYSTPNSFSYETQQAYNLPYGFRFLLILVTLVCFSYFDQIDTMLWFLVYESPFLT